MKDMAEALNLIQEASQAAMKALAEGNIQAVCASYEWASELAAAARSGRPLPPSPDSLELTLARRAAETLQMADAALVRVEDQIRDARQQMAAGTTPRCWHSRLKIAARALAKAQEAAEKYSVLRADLEALKLSNRTD